MVQDFTPEEERDLDALGEQLADAQASPWLARCLVAAFDDDWRPEWKRHPALSRLKPLTFRGWFQLEKLHSPFLVDDWARMAELGHLANAVSALSGQAMSAHKLQHDFTPEAVAALVRGARIVVREAFDMALPMRRPGDKKPADTSNHGFGEWLALLTLMAGFFRCRPADLADQRIDQAWALVATQGYLAGKMPAGANYLERDVARNP